MKIKADSCIFAYGRGRRAAWQGDIKKLKENSIGAFAKGG